MRLSNLRLSWNIFFIFLLVILLSVVVVGEFALGSLHDFYLASQREGLTSIAQLARREVTPELLAAGAARANPLARELAGPAGARITLILPDGRVIGDSEEEPERMENHADRPEFQAALKGEVGSAQRFSHTLGADLLYVAVPVERGGRVSCVARAARSLAEITRKESSVRRMLLNGCLAGALLAALVSLYLSHRLSRPIEKIRQAAERYAAGDYSNRLFITRPPEYVGLAKAMNRMAREMDSRLREITRQRNEREAILASMSEGVLAVDLDERIILLNASAERQLGIAAAGAVGQLVQEALRNAELQRFVGRTLNGETVAADESLLRTPGGTLLQMGSAPLRNEDGVRTGLLLVLTDITRLSRLESMRRDFVANVSHELRTPITSIKGFIETLRDGAIGDRENAGRFLEIVARQADRLSAIIEDLLALSRIEREAEKGDIALAACALAPLLEATIQHFMPQCAEKEIRIGLACPRELSVRANAPLLEQAVGNLLDNAIKFSPPGMEVRVAVSRVNGTVRIEVIDEGCGIAAVHLPRLFERFYRVDPARSRAAGGTGLGLAIVKHIIQAHGGRVVVASEPGRGSTFTIELPA